MLIINIITGIIFLALGAFITNFIFNLDKSYFQDKIDNYKQFLDKCSDFSDTEQKWAFIIVKALLCIVDVVITYLAVIFLTSNN